MKNILTTSLVTLLLVGCGASTEPNGERLPTDGRRGASIEVTPDSLFLLVGDEAQLSAVIRDVAGNPVSETLEWRSNKVDVASVSPEGVVHGVRACLALVTAQIVEGVNNQKVVSNQVEVTVVNAAANSAGSAACGG